MPSARRAARHTAETSSPGRGKMIAAVQILWKQIRVDLHGDEQSLRAERLAFITDILKLKRPVESVCDLSNSQLARVLDAMRRFQSQPTLTGYTPPVKVPATTQQETGANVIHLASAEQVFTINKLLDHLGWSDLYREKFIRDRFKRQKPQMLSPKQANSLLRILLNIAAQREAKNSGVTVVTRAAIKALIPGLKRRLGIDGHGGAG
jgi:hypothetical protein